MGGFEFLGIFNKMKQIVMTSYVWKLCPFQEGAGLKPSNVFTPKFEKPPLWAVFRYFRFLRS
ncbi:MAG: hypothetical protein A2731_00895 [Candidatus Buchananbacteria bacterium RIFCSPHIGHO2_01_FULL_39_8]|uniref:Uncharacterized protein n=1 Tax=Candidatus Buchananbacteria bacterium RIFCSPHIGHO2_01_FULL_39_8 TaxID=1797533 RepID=A0A1G1XYB7_9BACT|nr:MAG: hypothetical protein A2731_00895 [Candidatus Buchananbacteria bacterium RIFCSPHIGHO2_01_FULL_39_8]